MTREETILQLKEKIRILEEEISNGKSRKTEELMRRAEIRLRSGNWELDLTTGTIYGSNGALLLYGLDNSSMEYDQIKNIPLPEYRPFLDKAMKDLITGGKPYDVKFTIRNAKTGELIDLHSTAEYDRNRKTVFGILQDITARNKSEELIRRKTNDLANLLNVTMGLLDSSDRRTMLKDILEAANKLVGLDTGAVYSLQDELIFLESTIPELPENFPDEFRKAYRKNHPHISRALEAGKPVIVPDIQLEELTPEEKTIISQREMRTLLFIPLMASGQSYGILILGTVERLHEFNQDDLALCMTFSNIATLALENHILITNLKTAKEKAEESDRLKTAFLHNISHEIRTPLNAIIGFSGFLRQPDLAEREKNQFIDIIHQSNKQLLNIINDIFNASHIEAGQVFLNETITDLELLLTNLVNLFQSEVSQKGILLEFDAGEIIGSGIRIKADEGKLIQVLTNLLNNSLKFTNEGKITLGCRPAEGGLRFFVKDTGIGIPEEEHEKIFHRFYQVDKPESRVYAGAGLGLAISDAYVGLMGGKIRVISAPGLGSEFYFDLPVVPLIKQTPAGYRKDSSGEAFFGKKLTILVAEDEPSNFKYLEYLLKNHGAAILRAQDGLEAVEICKSEQKIDMALLDIKMPGMDGFTATREIRKLRPGLPVIMQTAYADPADMKKAFESGCSDFLAKPILNEKMISVLKKHLS